MKKNKDTGFVISQLTNDKTYDIILSSIEKFIQNNPFDQIVIFNSFTDRIDTKNIPILHLSHAQFFYGNLVLFDLLSVLLSNNFPNINKRYLYATDIPWYNAPSTPYSEWIKLYSSNNLNIITPNRQLFDIYQLMWKKPIGIAENFDYEQLQNIL